MSKKKSTVRRKPDHYPLKITILLFASFILFCLSLGFIALKDQRDFCANAISCIKDLSGEKESATTGTFMGKTVAVPGESKTDVYAFNETRAVLGETTKKAEKRIYVDLSNQRLYAYEGNNLIYNFPVSTGKWNVTPTGDFRIWVWLRYTRMSGGSKALGTYYNLPNVPYTMFYYNEKISKSAGYSLHGAYWHNNFGQPMSHGCVNMREEDVAKIFYWTNPTAKGTTYPTTENPGTLVTVYGTTPKVN